MDAQKLKHFEKLLLDQRARSLANVQTDEAAALESTDDGVKDSADQSQADLSRDVALQLGQRESQLLADIDQALLRIKEGSYGKCARCGRDIPEARLEAMPTARYDAECQTLIEQAQGEELPSL